MKGHEPIIAMRRNGIAPKIVFVNDFPDVCAKTGTCMATMPPFPWMAMRLEFDLRFLIGLMVSITGSTETRAKALAEKPRLLGLQPWLRCTAKDGKRWITSWSEVWKRRATMAEFLDDTIDFNAYMEQTDHQTKVRQRVTLSNWQRIGCTPN